MIHVRHIAGLLINPYFVCFIFLGIATYYLWRQKHFRFVKITFIIVLIGLYLISTPWIPRSLSNFYEDQYPAVNQVDLNIKWIVVLGGGKSDIPGIPANDSLSSASIKRLVEGVRLFRSLPNATLVLSGGSNSHYKSEAELFNELAFWFSIPKEKIILETNSINTADQARELKSIVHQQPFYLVTSAGHMPRAMALCKHGGLQPIAAPTDFTFFENSWVYQLIPNTDNLTRLSSSMHEILGQIWSRFRVQVT